MFVRFKKRLVAKEDDTIMTRYFGRTTEMVRSHGFVSYSVQVVESKRVDGSPRQLVIAHVGTIRTDKELGYFPMKAAKLLWHMAKDGQITRDDEAKLRTDIERRLDVQMPVYDPEVERRDKAEMIEALRGLNRRMG